MKKKNVESGGLKEPMPSVMREAAAVYGAPTEISVRAAKDQLSALLERAAQGEDIVITSDGRPKAMIVRYRPVIVGAPARSRAALRATMQMGPDSTAAIRAERDSRY
ncbi:MAG: type II toxin-antitoxin system prevent-host-death family antitoxin [Opitutaceae bacterium]|nr:type II toxin-antitoxin system prevent-host-death family antitoxin [Opitutaceae bacterium]